MMHRTIRRYLAGTVLAGGLLAFGGAAATAADSGPGSAGLLSGTQVAAPVPTPAGPGATPAALTGGYTANVAGTGAPAPAPEPANTGIDTGKLMVGLLFLAFGVLLTLFLRRKRP